MWQLPMLHLYKAEGLGGGGRGRQTRPPSPPQCPPRLGVPHPPLPGLLPPAKLG